jgi:hypothetical protein
MPRETAQKLLPHGHHDLRVVPDRGVAVVTSTHIARRVHVAINVIARCVTSGQKPSRFGHLLTGKFNLPVTGTRSSAARTFHATTVIAGMARAHYQA